MADRFGRFAVSRIGCWLVNSKVPDAVLGSSAADDLLELHLRTCLVCQAEAAHQDNLARAVHDELPEVPGSAAPFGLVDDVMEGIARREHLARVRGEAMKAGSLGLIGAGLTVVIFLLRRRRRTNRVEASQAARGR